MADFSYARVTEMWRSRNSSMDDRRWADSHQRIYHVQSVDNEEDAILAVVTNDTICPKEISLWCAPYYSNVSPKEDVTLRRGQVQCQPIDDEENWMVTANWTRRQNIATRGFDFSSGTQTRYRSLYTFGSAAPSPNEAPNFDRVMHIADGKTRGVQIRYGQFAYFEVIPILNLQMEDAEEWGSLVGKVNSSAFRNWSRHEVLLTGCQINEMTDDREMVEVRLNYEISKAVFVDIDTGVKMCKPGHAAFWELYDEVDDLDDGGKTPFLKPKVIAGYTEQVYEEADFHDTLPVGRLSWTRWLDKENKPDPNSPDYPKPECEPVWPTPEADDPEAQALARARIIEASMKHAEMVAKAYKRVRVL